MGGRANTLYGIALTRALLAKRANFALLWFDTFVSLLLHCASFDEFIFNRWRLNIFSFLKISFALSVRQSSSLIGKRGSSSTASGEISVDRLVDARRARIIVTILKLSYTHACKSRLRWSRAHRNIRHYYLVYSWLGIEIEFPSGTGDKLPVCYFFCNEEFFKRKYFSELFCFVFVLFIFFFVLVFFFRRKIDLNTLTFAKKFCEFVVEKSAKSNRILFYFFVVVAKVASS